MDWSVALLVSALLTAGYLLPLAVNGFLKAPLDEKELDKYSEPAPCMLVPVVVLAAATLLLGVFPTPLMEFVGGIAAALK